MSEPIVGKAKSLLPDLKGLPPLNIQASLPIQALMVAKLLEEKGIEYQKELSESPEHMKRVFEEIGVLFGVMRNMSGELATFKQKLQNVIDSHRLFVVATHDLKEMAPQPQEFTPGRS